MNLLAIRNHAEKIRKDDVLAINTSSESENIETETALPVGSVLSGISQAQQLEIQDLRFANKLLKQRVEHLEAELIKKEEIFNNVKKALGSNQESTR